MAFDFIDLFSGAAGTPLFGHVPDVGTTAWPPSTDTTNVYQGPPVSDIRFTGDNFTYNNIAGSSLVVSPFSAFASPSEEVRFALRFKTAVSQQTAGVALYTAGGTASPEYRVFFEDQTLRLSVGSPVVATSPALGLVANQILEVRIRLTDPFAATHRQYVVDYSTDAGVNWTTLATYEDATPAGTLKLGLWYDMGTIAQTATTGAQVGNLRAGANPQTPTLAVSPTTFAAATPGTLTLTGTGTAWRPGTPGAPAFTVTGGTGAGVSGQVVAGPNSATVTLDPGTAAGTLTITDPSGGTATVTVNATAATGFSLIPPSPASGVINVTSGYFTFQPNGVYTGTITPSMVGLDGSWSPPTLTWSGNAAAKIAAFTPTDLGTGTANGTAAPSLTAPAGVDYTSTAVPTTVNYLSVVAGFPPGLAGTVGYQVYADGAAYGSRVTAGVVERPAGSGTYRAIHACSPTALVEFDWDDGSGGSIVDGDPQPQPGNASGGLSLAQLNAALAPLLDPLYGYPTARGGTATSITLAADSGTDLVGQFVVILDGACIDQVRKITAIDPVTKVATVEPAWVGGPPDPTSVYGLQAGADGSAWLGQVGALEAGETGRQTLRVMRARDIGRWDTTTNPGFYTYFCADGVTEAFRIPLLTPTGRNNPTLGGGL